MNALSDRLNQILPRITSPDFLSGEGIGNEIACYIFDYPAADELLVRDHLQTLRKRLASHHADIRVVHLDLLDVAVDYLRKRNKFDKAMQMWPKKGDAGMLKALKGMMAAEKIVEFIGAEYQPAEHDLILVSGVGSVWPMLRAHRLLNCMHPVLAGTPLLMFYPGRYDGTTLRLFGRIASTQTRPGKNPYYRAFPLFTGGDHA